MSRKSRKRMKKLQTSKACGDSGFHSSAMHSTNRLYRFALARDTIHDTVFGCADNVCTHVRDFWVTEGVCAIHSARQQATDASHCQQLVACTIKYSQSHSEHQYRVKSAVVACIGSQAGKHTTLPVHPTDTRR